MSQLDIDRGSRADRLLNDDEFKAAVEALRSALIAQWEQCPIRDKDGAHELKLMLKLLGDLQAHLRSVADTGKLAKLEVDRLESLKLKVRKVIHG
jgi:hypothetical protein